MHIIHVFIWSLTSPDSIYHLRLLSGPGIAGLGSPYGQSHPWVNCGLVARNAI